MKKLLWLFLASVAFAQTPVTVTGTIVDATNNPATSGYVQFDIQPQPSNVHFFVPGSLAIVLSTATCGINPSGQLKNNALSGPCQVWGNDSISPSNTCYNVTLAPGGIPTQSIPNELIGGSTYDLAAPQFCTVSSLVPQFSTITSANSQQNIIPGVNHVYTVGLNNFRYSQGWFDTIFLTNSLAVGSGGTGGVTVPTLNRFLKGTGSVWTTSNGAASGIGSCLTHLWVSATNSDAGPTCLQPNFTDLLGSLDPTQDYNVGPGVSTNTKITINARGRVTAMTQAASTDLSDSAGLERLANKDQPAGYPGLSGGFINGTELPAPQAGVFGGVKSSTAGAGQYVNGIDTTGAVTYGTSGLSNPVVLSATYTNATTTFSDVTGMSWPILANTNYALTCQFMWQGSAGTAGPKFQLTGPASPTNTMLTLTSAVTATTTIYAANGGAAFSTPIANTGTVTSTTNFPAMLNAGIINGVNAGTLKVQSASNGVGTLTHQAGSFCNLVQQ